MSRSYKKYAGDKGNDRFMKNYANRRVRRILIADDNDWVDPIPNYNNYRKYTCPWDICDWRVFYYGNFSSYKRQQRIMNYKMLVIWKHWPHVFSAEWDEVVWYKEYMVLRAK